jgi:hypothetical protein
MPDEAARGERSRAGPERYARAVEALWRERVPTAAEQLLSPRDFGLIAGWHERGVPLALVRETIERELRGRPTGRVLTFATIAPLIDEAWTVIARGRLTAAAAPPCEDGTAIDAWRAVIAAAPGSAGARRLSADLDRLSAGEDAEVIDRELDEALAELWPAEVAEITGEVEAELEPYRGRLAPERFAESRRRGVLTRLRRRLGLPRLADGRIDR